MHLKIILLLLLLSVWSHGLVPETPMSIASRFQEVWDVTVHLKDDDGLNSMMVYGFYYEDCRGKKHQWDEFIKIVTAVKPQRGKVLNARADKNHVIYQVQYSKKNVREVMITKSWIVANLWQMERAQPIIC